MKNHKWQPKVENAIGQRSQECARCGLVRFWLYSPWNRWEYLTITGETFRRPDCKKRRKRNE